MLGLFNSFWISGEVPEEWTTSKILPIVKPGKDPRQLQHTDIQTSTYRPISQTSVLCKIFERLLLQRILRNDIIQKFHPHHADFLPNKDSTYILSLIYHKIVQDKNEKKFCIDGHSFSLQLSLDRWTRFQTSSNWN
ncbi:hypothetical protein AVEN_44778-1 [Araneus ventricosus]|uniref:Reverse transcriptase domain-containing protein n=1 Tax=Araneus ventricosus TaxID=182803 RepID=A0A4Y2QIX0_ARAVE|nr:hypothetical protein AVEN_44778-1 [Araneus ventricosus]